MSLSMTMVLGRRIQRRVLLVITAVASDATALAITGDPSSVLTTPLGNVDQVIFQRRRLSIW